MSTPFSFTKEEDSAFPQARNRDISRDKNADLDGKIEHLIVSLDDERGAVVDDGEVGELSLLEKVSFMNIFPCKRLKCPEETNKKLTDDCFCKLAGLLFPDHGSLDEVLPAAEMMKSADVYAAWSFDMLTDANTAALPYRFNQLQRGCNVDPNKLWLLCFEDGYRCWVEEHEQVGIRSLGRLIFQKDIDSEEICEYSPRVVSLGKDSWTDEEQDIIEELMGGGIVVHEFVDQVKELVMAMFPEKSARGVNVSLLDTGVRGVSAPLIRLDFPCSAYQAEILNCARMVHAGLDSDPVRRMRNIVREHAMMEKADSIPIIPSCFIVPILKMLNRF